LVLASLSNRIMVTDSVSNWWLIDRLTCKTLCLKPLI
jgi:hypothetical protein